MNISFISALIRLRVMPLTIVCLGLMFCIKIYDLAVGTNELSRMMLAGEAYAVTPDATQATPQSDIAAGKQPEAPASAEGGAAAAAGAEATEAPAKTEEASPAEQKLDKEYLDSPEAKQHFSQIELNILQSLAARRAKLEKMEDEVQTKENLLAATEVRLGKRIEEIKTLEINVRTLLAQYEKQEDASVRSLVKIYENMKPKDAARIFNELEMPVLLMVADRMAERKVAPVLAQMDPKKAKELTVELAEDRQMLNDTKQALDGSATQ